MTGSQRVHVDPLEDVQQMMTTYRRLANMDPPALRSLAVDLERLSEASSASVALQPSSITEAQALRDARRAAAARAALASLDSEI